MCIEDCKLEHKVLKVSPVKTATRRSCTQVVVAVFLLLVCVCPNEIHRVMDTCTDCVDTTTKVMVHESTATIEELATTKHTKKQTQLGDDNSSPSKTTNKDASMTVTITSAVVNKSTITSHSLGVTINNDTSTQDKEAMNVTYAPSNMVAAVANKTSTVISITPDSLFEVMNDTVISIDDRLNALPGFKKLNPMTSIYSKEAVAKLDAVKRKAKNGETIRVVMNGGSSAAGAPDVVYEDRFHQYFGNQFSRQFNTSVETIDRSHGARNTMHSAHLMTSFMPTNVDMVIWEFSINDGHSESDVRNSMTLWLRNLEATQSTPPLVLLVYLWRSPLQQVDGKLSCRTFTQHRRMGRAYDFVLGHINLAAYFDSLRWTLPQLKDVFFADRHHPNALTHQLLGSILWKLFDEAETYRGASSVTEVKKAQLDWKCGMDTPAKRAMKQMFWETNQGIARASYTADLPRNDDTEPHVLVPIGGNHTMTSFGKIADIRNDRQNGIILPCCKDGAHTFNISQYSDISAFQLTLRCQDERKSDLRIVEDGKLSDRVPDLIRPRDWKCLLGGYNMGVGDLTELKVDFLLYQQPKNLQTIGFCDVKCTGLASPVLPLVSIAVF